jgi:4-hydroxy-3-polyprenylbenzoate decarboxylase
MARYIVGITGASGSIYGVRVIEELLLAGNEVHVVLTNNGEKVLSYELEKGFEEVLAELNSIGGRMIVHNIEDLFAPIASGSFKVDGMVIVPCSMSALGEIANGVSKNLLGRAADVCIKEGRRLIIVPRETPISPIHLKNMLTLSQLGVTMMAAMPGFYNRPKTLEDIINFVVGRVLSGLGIENNLYLKWGNDI